MLKHITIALTVATATLAVCAAFSQPPVDQTPSQPMNKVVIPVNKTAATSGREMYGSYCAPCHGTDGKGNGPAASALRTLPTDLTQLSKNNGGRFPGSHIVTVLQFGSEMPSHGSMQMPVWGPILGRMNITTPQDKQLRMSNLSRYLETIQVK
jgi:mono/diheme cytochrome c family protein